MNCFLVDFENIKTNEIKNLINMSAGDEVIIFYTEQCKGITLDVIENITKNNVNFEKIAPPQKNCFLAGINKSQKPKRLIFL